MTGRREAERGTGVRVLVAPKNLEGDATSEGHSVVRLCQLKTGNQGCDKMLETGSISGYAESGFHLSLDGQSGSVCELRLKLKSSLMLSSPRPPCYSANQREAPGCGCALSGC